MGVWVCFEHDGQVVKERRLRRHFTRRGAFRYAQQACYNPTILLKLLDTIQVGYAVFPEPEVRRRFGRSSG